MVCPHIYHLCKQQSQCVSVPNILHVLSSQCQPPDSAFWRNIPREVKMGKCRGAIFYYSLVTSGSKVLNPREFHIHIIIGFFFIYSIQLLFLTNAYYAHDKHLLMLQTRWNSLRTIWSSVVLHPISLFQRLPQVELSFSWPQTIRQSDNNQNSMAWYSHKKDT